jgi:hypothetical protein
MTSEPTMQSMACVYEPAATTTAPPCPMCGGGLVPLRGQWRCSRCYFALCIGCEPVLGHEGGDTGD